MILNSTNLTLIEVWQSRAKVIYIGLAIMISLLVDTYCSILPKLWFLKLESDAILKWRESLNGRYRQSKRMRTKEEDRPGIEP